MSGCFGGLSKTTMGSAFVAKELLERLTIILTAKPRGVLLQN